MTNELPAETVIDDPAQTVEGFLYAMQDEDWDTMAAAMDENIVYHNVGMPIIDGRHRAMKFLRRGLERPSAGFEVVIHRIAVEGTTVLTERTDVLRLGRLRLEFWVCGVFEVRNGRITLWRDYFDYLDLLVKAPLRGIAALIKRR
jgi:limonene-1,2-epoxide hydrolase